MKYLFVTTHFQPDFHYGGVVESGTRLYKYLSQCAAFRLSTVSKDPERVARVLGDNGVCYRSIWWHGLAFSFQAIAGLWRDVGRSDVILVNGIFTFPVTLAQWYAVLRGRPFGVATRGGLLPWRVAHKKWKKFLYIRMVTLPLMRRARFIHVTSDAEEDAIRDLGFHNTVKVTNGIDFEMYGELPTKYSYAECRDDRVMFLFLSRTDKEKGLDLLIWAYRKLCERYPRKDFVLLIVGPDHQGYLRGLHVDYAQENMIRMEGVYGEKKIQLIRRADVVVLPSYSENFGNIVAEALACERPVITTTGTPWQAVAEVGCGVVVEPEREALFSALERVYRMGGEARERMGRLGRTYVRQEFDWSEKARELFACLQALR